MRYLHKCPHCKIEVTSMTIADAQLGLEKEIKKYLKEKNNG